MKKTIAVLLALIMFCPLYPSQASANAASDTPLDKQGSYFSRNPDALRQRVCASDFGYYFIDEKDNLCSVDENSQIELILTNAAEVVSLGRSLFIVRTDGSLWSVSYENSYGGENYLGRELDEANVFDDMRKPGKVIDNVSYVMLSYSSGYAFLADSSLWGWGETQLDY